VQDQVGATVKRDDISAKATAYDIFLPESMDSADKGPDANSDNFK
jgi:hypothetical protein